MTVSYSMKQDSVCNEVKENPRADVSIQILMQPLNRNPKAPMARSLGISQTEISFPIWGKKRDNIYYLAWFFHELEKENVDKSLSTKSDM